MKFILDAHIPPSLCNLFAEKGFTAIHTLNLPNKNQTSDKDIIKIASKQGLIVVTKDSDFYFSHLINKEPEKLLLIKTGNLSTKDLKNIFDNQFTQIIEVFKTHNLIEFHKDCLIY